MTVSKYLPGAKPIVKWAGGKQAMLKYLLPLVPKEFNNYIEPFFGGGALYFALSSELFCNEDGHVVILNDANSALINVYQRLQTMPDELSHGLFTLQKRYDDATSVNNPD